MTRPVLIIEDNADIAECLHYILKMENFETRVARTGETNIKTLRTPGGAQIEFFWGPQNRLEPGFPSTGSR